MVISFLLHLVSYSQIAVIWFDHTRDLMHMVNHFRSEMIQLIVGFGHSMGGNQM